MCPSSLQVDTIACVHIPSMTSNCTPVQTATGGRLPKDRHRRFGVDIQRWGLLAHDVKESEQLVEILNSNTNGTRKQTLLCVGHRHGLSRAGPVRLYFDDPVVETGAWVLESAALPDVSSVDPRCGDRVSDLIVCMHEASGLLRPCRMPFSAMAQTSQGVAAE
jgi:hypothetical protein